MARFVGAWVPDATAAATLMIVLLAGAALALGNTAGETLDALYRGLWMLLAFSMQMTLLLLLSSVVSGTPLFRRLIERAARLPGSATGVIAATVLLTGSLSYLYWALGTALGPLIALQCARVAEERGIPIDFPCLLAVAFAAGSVWQFGLSSTAALLVATPGHFLEEQTGVMPLSATIWSPGALLLTLLFPLALILLARLVMPRVVQPLSDFPGAQALGRLAETAPVGAQPPPVVEPGFGSWSERTRVFPILLAIVLVGWLWHHFFVNRLGLDLNSMVTLLLLIALLMQPDLAAFSRAIQAAVQSVWQIIVLYQVYGAVAGLMQFTTVGAVLSGFFAKFATPLTFTLLTAIGGTLVALFVPSSGGQWIIQGHMTTEVAAIVGATPQQGLLALGIGDQMGNLLSPFWMVVVAGIARVEFRRLYGYAMVFAIPWFVLGVVLFTLLPA
jgi:short-chain fatty acids transporter